jgi:hypothetical protein
MKMTFLVTALGLASLTGCGTTATISRVNEPTVEAKIIGGDERDVHVDANGTTITIPRSTITDIDHPGNVAGVIGGIVSAYGVANVAVGAENCDKEGAAYCTGVFLPIGIGLPIMIYGIATYSGSTSALKEKPIRVGQGSLFVLPTHEFAGQPKTPGLSVGGTF